MLPSLLPVTVFLGLITGSLEDLYINNSLTSPGNPSTTSLQYVYAVFRHGIRSPLYEPYPNDPYKSKYNQYFPGSPGELTKIGKQVMYKIGKKLKVRYGYFVGDYTDEKVHVTSTNMSRTIMSALSVMAGLFPPSKPIIEDLEWQPVPVWEDITDVDKAYIYNDEKFPELGLQVCPRYGKLIKKGYETVVNPDLTKRRYLIYKEIQHFTGKSDVNSINTLYKIWDTLQFESLNGLSLPKWAIKPQPHYHNKPLYPDLMQPIMVDWFIDTENLNHNEEMLHFYSGPLFNSIHNKFYESSRNKHSEEKLRFHATHDTTLFALLWALGLEKPAAVGPGDGILFELHQENNTSTVQVIYFDASNYTFKQLLLPLCPSPCALSDFIKTTPGLTQQQWQKRCKI